LPKLISIINPCREVIEECNRLCQHHEGGSFEVVHDAAQAAKEADIVYTDSWMSYGISPEAEEERTNLFLFSFSPHKDK